MSEGSGSQHTTTLRDYLRVVRRRKWIILQALVLVPALAVGFSLHQKKLYRATAQVLLVQQQLANQLNGITDPSVYQQADRIAQTQADLTRVPKVVDLALRLAGRPESRTAFLASSSATPKTNANLLDLSVTHHDPLIAKRLATAYADAYARYRTSLDTAPYIRASQRATHELRDMAAAGDARTGAYAELLSKRNQLDQMTALLTAGAVPVQNAETAAKVQPRPVRNGILGLALGIVLGVGLAFLWEALDTRVRSAEEIGERLGMPLLARLPEPPRKLRRDDSLVMLAEPGGPHAEMFRMLRTNLDFMRLSHEAKTIVVTSAVEQEGKSTTAANLAVALARAGQRVAIVDLDLRRPYLDRFFQLRNRPGVTQVALGSVELGSALNRIELNGTGNAKRFGRLGKAAVDVNGNGSHANEGELVVIGSGPLPPNPGEFVGSLQLERILTELRGAFDTVLIDAPPVLQVGDAVALSARADAVLVVARMNIVRRPMLSELRRLLDATPAKKLGFVLAGAESEDGYGGGGYYAYHRAYERDAVPVS